jgi:hypothetical protein
MVYYSSWKKPKTVKTPIRKAAQFIQKYVALRTGIAFAMALLITIQTGKNIILEVIAKNRNNWRKPSWRFESTSHPNFERKYLKLITQEPATKKNPNPKMRLQIAESNTFRPTLNPFIRPSHKHKPSDTHPWIKGFPSNPETGVQS